MKKFSSIVIGLGQMGQGYDYDHPDSSRILTHATGFLYHEYYELIAGVDPGLNERQRFEKKFGRPAYPNIQTLLSKHRPEIISICVPTNYHFQVFKEVITCRPAAVICEKPIADSLDDAMNMKAMADKANCTLLVNYMRRFEPGVLRLKEIIEKGEAGDILKGVVFYSKGFLNNGSHFIDLLLFLIGEVNRVDVLKKGRIQNKREPEPDVCICFDNSEIYFLSADEQFFTMNSMRLIGSRGEINYNNGGNEILHRNVQPHPNYRKHKILSSQANIIPNDLKRFQWHVLESLKNHLVEGTPLNSSGNSAIRTLEVVKNILSLI